MRRRRPGNPIRSPRKSRTQRQEEEKKQESDQSVEKQAALKTEHKSNGDIRNVFCLKQKVRKAERRENVDGRGDLAVGAELRAAVPRRGRGRGPGRESQTAEKDLPQCDAREEDAGIPVIRHLDVYFPLSGFSD